MTQTEETAGLAAQDHSELSPEDLKYLRVGHISTGRFCDKVVAWFVSEIPPQAVSRQAFKWPANSLLLPPLAMVRQGLRLNP